MPQVLPQVLAHRAASTARVVQVLLAVLISCFVVSTLPGVRGRPGFDTLLDGWLQGSVYVLCAGLALLRPMVTAVERTLWSLVAAALAARALGFVAYLAVVRRLDPVPYPSVADAGWLATCFLLLLVLALRLRDRTPRLSSSLVLDALLAALTTAGVAGLLLHGTLLGMTREGTPPSAVATNLAYPVSDVALVSLAIGLLLATRWRPRPSDWVLVAGVIGFALTDTVYLYLLSDGSFRPGSWLSALTVLATALVAVAAWVRPGVEVPRVEQSRPPGMAVPVVLSVICVGVLVRASRADVPVLSILLTAAGLLAAGVRAVQTIVQDRSEASVALRAKNDELLRFQALVETSGDFIAIAGVDGAVRYVNPAGRRIVGLEPDADVTRTTIDDYLTEEGRRLSAEVEVPAVVAHGRWEGESTLRNIRGGPPVPVAIASFLMLHPETGEPFALATVQRDITERLAADRAVHELAEQRQDLLGRLVEAQEDERSRIAADVHDDSVQALAAVELRLGLLGLELAGSAPHLTASVADAQEAVAGAMQRLRHLLFDLESPALNTSLATALDEAAAVLLEDSGVRWEVTGDRDADLPAAARVTAYRIAKEAMVNARKHAQASAIQIILTPARAGVDVTVQDDGRGFDVTASGDRPGHLGLSSMRDRAAVAGGDLRVVSRPGGGTAVTVWLPAADR
jgi:PAS domain S-box-containing protein